MFHCLHPEMLLKAPAPPVTSTSGIESVKWMFTFVSSFTSICENFHDKTQVTLLWTLKDTPRFPRAQLVTSFAYSAVRSYITFHYKHQLVCVALQKNQCQSAVRGSGDVLEGPVGSTLTYHHLSSARTLIRLRKSLSRWYDLVVGMIRSTML